jgi:hypothetical protein
LLPEIVFVGGCTTALLITDPAATAVRVTDDVDVIVRIASYSEYARFSKRLRTLGFSEDSTEGGPICRWLCDQMKLDVMPTAEKILGFSSRWYTPALRNAAVISINRLELRIATVPYFVGMKLEAFRRRGKGDFYSSSDLEDIVTVIDGRPSLVEEIGKSPSTLRNYIGKEIGRLLDDPEFVNALPGHLAGDEISQARIPRVLHALNSIRAPGVRRKHQSASARTRKPST